MNYGLLEDEIVARLAPIVTAGHEVEAMPSNQGDNSSVQHKGRITVQVGAAKGDTNDIQSQSATSDQYEDVFVEIIIRSKRLRTNGGYAGIYDLSELARKLLQGWKSTMSWTPFVYVDFTPLAPDNITDSVFTYSLRMKTTTLLPAQLDEDVSVLIDQITVLPDSETGPLAPTGEIYASAYNVDTSGDQIVLAWISENGYNVEINGVGTGLSDSGSATVTVTADTTYTLTVTRGATVFEVSVSVTVGSSCADATVENSDQTVSVTVASGGTEEFPDTDFSINSELVVEQPSGVDKNITVTVNGDAPISTTVVSENEVDLEAAIAAVSLTIGVYSDAGHTTPITTWSWGDTVYLKATATGYTPDEYSFFISDGVRTVPIVTQASGEYTWIVTKIPSRGTLELHCEGQDTVGGTRSSDCVEVDVSAYYIDVFSGAFQCCSIRLEKETYTGALVSVRRSSDNATKDFYPDSNGALSMSSEDGSGTSLSSWVGSSHGHIYKLYDQTGNGNDWEQATLADQYQIISEGVFFEDSNGLATPIAFGGNDGFDMTGFQGHAVCDSDMVIITQDEAFTNYCGSGAATYGFLTQSGSASTGVTSNYGTPDLYIDGVQVISPTRKSANANMIGIGGCKIIQHEGADTTDATWSTAYFGKYPPSATFTMLGGVQFNANFDSDQSSTRSNRHLYIKNFYKCI